MGSGSQASPPNSLKKRSRNQCHLQILLVKLKNKLGMDKIPSVSEAKNDVCLDFLAWVSQEQPAAARSSQERPAAANSSSLKRASAASSCQEEPAAASSWLR